MSQWYKVYIITSNYTDHIDRTIAAWKWCKNQHCRTKWRLKTSLHFRKTENQWKMYEDRGLPHWIVKIKDPEVATEFKLKFADLIK